MGSARSDDCTSVGCRRLRLRIEPMPTSSSTTFDQPARNRDRDRQRLGEAHRLLMDFADRTGLTSARTPRRYLWTDAFAVCTLLGLARAGRAECTGLALHLVDRVHRELARHRQGDARVGWLSGLDEDEGGEHPTCAGLRIGKPLPERAPGQPLDPRLEWERDGQYFHYLTKWMHALDLVARSTGELRFHLWSRELAEVAHRAFAYTPPGGARPRMHWKMSIDLSRPLVPSMGHHDPLDGLVTYAQIEDTAGLLGAEQRQLTAATSSFASMLEGQDLATADPLGLGGLLLDAGRVEQLVRRGAAVPEGLLETILEAALAGLEQYGGSGELRRPAETRLAFRELGLAIGMTAVDRMVERREHLPPPPRIRALVDALGDHRVLRPAIEAFWLDPAHRDVASWRDHQDINDVMLAAALVPGSVAFLPPARR